MINNYTVKISEPDLRDKIWTPSILKDVSQIPKEVDLRPLMSPIQNQMTLGSCTAHGVVALREYLQLKNKPMFFTRLSRLFIYYHERLLEGTVDRDCGAQIKDGMKVLQQRGVPPEALDPYFVAKFKDKPSSVAEAAASLYKIKTYYKVNTLQDLKLALAEGLPVVIGISIYSSFESKTAAKTGIIPLPDKKKEKRFGGHCMCAVGYDDNKNYIIVRNSWGIGWGDKGYCYLPYDFINDPTLLLDMWTGY